MTISDDELRMRLRLGEDSLWEFKEFRFREDRPVSPSRDDLANEIGAFANAHGGTLLLGVTDDGTVQGMTRSQLQRVDALVAEVCRNSIEPPLEVEVHKMELDGAAFVVVEVPAGPAQHQSKGLSFVRVGGSKQQMTGDERLRLAQRRSQARYMWFDEQPVEGSGFASLQPELWEPLVSARNAADPVQALVKLGVLSEDADGVMRATVAGVLLCCTAPHERLSQARITATRYEGTSRSSAQADSREIIGPLNVQIADAMAFVRRHNRVAARKTPARVDVPEYSAAAVFEAVVNAVVHRDYSIATSAIRLMMFDDRLVIYSPGSLPNNLTLDSMDSRQMDRNPTIASIIQRIEVGDIHGAQERRYFVERRGDGVPTIRNETWATSGKQATYRLVDDTDLELTIPAARLERTAASVVVTVYGDAVPLHGVEILALFPNRTWKRSVTDRYGEAVLDLYATHLPMTVFAAGAGRAAGRVERWVPADGALSMELDSHADGGSVIFAESSGHVPGLIGRLNPILDSIGRTYIYASNIAVEHGKQQPVHLALGEPLDMVDADGNRFEVTVVDIVGRSALLEYRRTRTA